MTGYLDRFELQRVVAIDARQIRQRRCLGTGGGRGSAACAPWNPLGSGINPLSGHAWGAGGGRGSAACARYSSGARSSASRSSTWYALCWEVLIARACWLLLLLWTYPRAKLPGRGSKDVCLASASRKLVCGSFIPENKEPPKQDEILSLLAVRGLALRAQIPIAAVQGLLAVDVLDRNPVMHFILHAPVLDSVITAILPSAPLHPTLVAKMLTLKPL